MQEQYPHDASQQGTGKKTYNFSEGLRPRFCVMRESRCAKFAQCVKGYSHATCINIALTPEKQSRYRRVSLTLKNFLKSAKSH